MARALDHLFDDQRGRTEGALGFAHRRLDVGVQRVQRVQRAHALAAAAGRGLEHHRQAQAAHGLRDLCGVIAGAVAARHHRHAGGDGLALGQGLVAKAVDDLRRRADEGQTGGFDGAGERRVLGQKAEARMDGFGADALRRLDHALDAQIAFGRRRAADFDALADLAYVQAVTVGAGMNTGRGHAQAAAGAGNAAGNFAAVGNQDFLEHGRVSVEGRPHHMRNTPMRVGMALVRPARSSSRAITSRVSVGSMTMSHQRLRA